MLSLIKRKKFNINLITSLLLHAVILLFIFFAWHQIETINKCNKAENNILQAYTYSLNTTSSSISRAITSENKIIKKPNTTDSKESIKRKKISESTNKSESSENKTINSEQTTDQLINLLHAAIQAQQQYPHNALIQKQTGTVTVSFILFPDGQITSIKIMQSSGFESLDEAAVNAVKNAAPIKEVSSYLTTAKNFNISLHFSLDTD